MAESDAPPPPVPPENGGTLAWLLAQYRRDPDFTGEAEHTRRSYDDCAAWLRDHFGDLPLAAVTPASAPAPRPPRRPTCACASCAWCGAGAGATATPATTRWTSSLG